jgi:hypothetical protein
MRRLSLLLGVLVLGAACSGSSGQAASQGESSDDGGEALYCGEGREIAFYVTPWGADTKQIHIRFAHDGGQICSSGGPSCSTYFMEAYIPAGSDVTGSYGEEGADHGGHLYQETYIDGDHCGFARQNSFLLRVDSYDAETGCATGALEYATGAEHLEGAFAGADSCS